MRIHLRIGLPVRRQPFIYPGQSPRRVAVLVPWFQQARLAQTELVRRVLERIHRNRGVQTRIFTNGWTVEAERFAPQAIAGNLNQLMALAENPPESLTHGLVVLGHLGLGRLTDSDRDFLWHAFGVPAFEQIIGERGLLLATECEAHSGLHVECHTGEEETRILVNQMAGQATNGDDLSSGHAPSSNGPKPPLDYAPFDDPGVRLTHDACPCGRTSPRLLPRSVSFLAALQSPGKTPKTSAASAGSSA